MVLRSFKHRRASSGATLIELMAAIMIVSVLTAMAGPAFSDFISKQRVKTVASRFYAALLKARSEAIKRNANVTLAPLSSTWQSGWKITDAANTTLHSYPALTGVEMSSGSVTSVVYSSSGRIQGTSLPQFNVHPSSSTSTQNCVSVQLSGMPYLKASSC